MSNTWNTTQFVTTETLRLLLNKLVVGSYMATGQNKQFTKPFPVGDTVQIEYPWRPLVTTGLTYQPQAIGLLKTTVTLDQVKGIHFEWDNVERVLNMPRGEAQLKEKILGPSASRLAQQIDTDCARYAYQNTNNIVGTLGTDPTTFDATSAAALQRMTELACPVGDGERAVLIPPSVTRALKTASITLFQPADAIAQQYKKGVIGMADGFTFFSSMSLANHTAGVWAGAVTLSSAVTSGATSLAVTCTNGDTFKKGDVIGLNGYFEVNPETLERTTTQQTKQVVVSADVTATSTSATVGIVNTLYGPGVGYQNIDALPASSTVLTLFPGTSNPNGKSGKQGLAIQDQAFCLAWAEMENPKQGTVEIVSMDRDPETGIGIAFVRDFDAVNRKMINRFDAGPYGWGNFYGGSNCVRILGA